MLRAFAGGRLFGESYGTGTPWVLALHGWRRTHADFDGVLGERPGTPALDALALDLPGFGAAPPPPAAWGSGEYAEAIAAVLDEMGDKVVVLGHSFGGRVAVQLAALWPERVSALVLSGVPFYRPAGARTKPKARYRIVRSLARRGLVSEGRLEAARRRHGSEDYRAATGVMREVFVRVVAEEYGDVLSGLSCPVELVWGSEDTEARVEVARRAEGVLSEARLVVLAGVGHLTPTAVPAELRAALERVRP
ncbi:MAG TPA: alpha/beta hydrolase [Acidimicrobiales bacterium]|nr:alpha/beta hydrolase [Acidimicrobiales bacterium]